MERRKGVEKRSETSSEYMSKGYKKFGTGRKTFEAHGRQAEDSQPNLLLINKVAR